MCLISKLARSLCKKSLRVLALMAFRQSSEWMLTTVKFSFSSSLRLNFVELFSTSTSIALNVVRVGNR